MKNDLQNGWLVSGVVVAIWRAHQRFTLETDVQVYFRNPPRSDRHWQSNRCRFRTCNFLLHSRFDRRGQAVRESKTGKNMKRDHRIKWAGGLSFVGTAGSGHSVVMDSDKQIGMSPMEMLADVRTSYENIEA